MAVTLPMLSELQSSLSSLGPDWCNQTKVDTNTVPQIRLCKIASNAQASLSTQPLVISHSLIVNPDLSWKLFVQGHNVEKTNQQLAIIPDHLDSTSLQLLISTLDSTKICPGHPDPVYVEMARNRKGVFKGQNGQIRATLEISHPVVDSNGKVFPATIRMVECELLIASSSTTCCSCRAYRKTLRAFYSRFIQAKATTLSKFTNN